MTKEKKALWLRLLAKFYGIEGQLDEYKEKELNRIGNRGFMFSSIYSFMSTSFCFLRFDQFSETDLMILVSVNMIVYFLLIPTYLSTAITLAGLTEIDLTETEYPKARRKAITRGIRTIFTYGIGMFFFESGIDVLFEGKTLTNSLSDMSNLSIWLLLGLCFGITSIFTRLKTLKKAVTHSQQ